MHRLKRKNRAEEDLAIMDRGGMLDLFDNVLKEAYRMNDNEYDYIAGKLTEEEMGEFLNEKKTSFSDGRKKMEIFNKYMTQYENEKI